MKKPFNFLMMLLFFLCACEKSPFQPGDRLPVQGRWKVEQVSFQTMNKKDSVINTELGFIELGSCKKIDNEAGRCEKGRRIYANGQVIDFRFQTRWSDSGKRLFLHSKIPGLSHDLIGGFNINKLTKTEMVFSCTSCEVGGIAYRKFELRATK